MTLTLRNHEALGKKYIFIYFVAQAELMERRGMPVYFQKYRIHPRRDQDTFVLLIQTQDVAGYLKIHGINVIYI